MFGISWPWCRFYCACILIIQLSEWRKNDLVLGSGIYVFSSVLKGLGDRKNPKLSIWGIHLVSRKHSYCLNICYSTRVILLQEKKKWNNRCCMCYGFNLEERDKVRLLKQECGYSVYHSLPFQTNVMDQASTRKDPESSWDAWNWVCGFEVAVGSVYLFSLWWVLLYWMRTHLPCQRLTFSLQTSVSFREDTLSVNKGFTSWRNSFFITTSFVPQKMKGCYLLCCSYRHARLSHVWPCGWWI